MYRILLAIIWTPIHRLLARLTGPKLPGAFHILCFHRVLDYQQPWFDRLLQYILDKHGVITPQEAEDRLQGKIIPGPSDKIPCLLTFDDGFKMHGILARRFLDKYGIKAIFFICPGLMELPPDEQRQAIDRYILGSTVAPTDLTERMTLMSWSEIESLISAGHTIGTHSQTHRPLAGLDEADLMEETVTAAARIKAKLGLPAKWFAPPFGDLKSVDSHSMAVIGRHFQFSCTGIRGLNSAATHPLELLREGIDLHHPFSYQKMILAGGLDFLYRAQVRALRELTPAGRGC